MKDFISIIVPYWLRRWLSPEPRLQGALDAIIEGYILGWVRQRGTDKPIHIDLLIDGQVVASNEFANKPRPDVHDAGIGDGAYGFAIPVPSEYLGADTIDLMIRMHGREHAVLTQRMTYHRDRGEYRPLRDGAIASGIVMNIDKFTDRVLQGWCVDASDRGKLIDLDILLDGEFLAFAHNDQPRKDLKELGISDGLGGVQADLPLRWLDPGQHVIALRAHGKTLLENAITIPERTAVVDYHRIAKPVGGISIIVPVHNAASDLQVCIQRLIAWTPETVPILFIDDASTDPLIADLLRCAARRPNMRYLRNETNQGFTRSVNLGFDETGRDDVIILNSDARVTPGWLEGMALAAHSAPRIATVTPMSDRAGVFSAPQLGNDNILPEGIDEIIFARAFRRHSLGLYPTVPTGNGFCMFIRRRCIEEIGGFDADAFPRGYGEENDFCMRAIQSGWRHIIDDRTYVFHARSKSFGEARNALMKAGRQVIDSRYPEYETAIRIFTSGPKIALARQRARVALTDCATSPPLPRILFVVSTQTGGTPQTNRDLMAGLVGKADCWLLQCDGTTLELNRMAADSLDDRRIHHLDETVDPISHRSEEYDAVVSQWLLRLDPDIVHIRHLGWHGLALPQIAKALGKRVIFSFHDFYALCPSVKLLDEAMRFCGGTCTPQDGYCRAELWPKDALPALKHKWVHIWRQRFAEALAPCDAFITTSPSARERILEHMPSVMSGRFKVIPHGRDFSVFRRLAQPPVDGDPLRILLPGTITRAKGLDVVHDLLGQDVAGKLEFHILGEICEDDGAIARTHPRLICHGHYDRDSFAERVEAIRPQLGAVLSIWDETYCHTLTELWAVGVPTIVLDFPTLAQRVRDCGGGWVLRHEDISALYKNVLRIAFDMEKRAAAEVALARWQEKTAMDNTVSTMADSYLDLYRAVLEDRYDDIA